VLVGRAAEQGRIDGLLQAARRGESGVLVVRGEAGVGKTALLDYAVASATGMQVIRTRGIESESELAFSGLLEFVRPVLAYLDDLPPPQADALRGAFALSPSTSGDPFPIYAGMLSLLAAAAEEGPLLGLIDDAQWLDRGSAEVLAFASRRLENEGILLLWAVRDEDEISTSPEGLDELRLKGVDPDAALELLTATSEQIGPRTAQVLVEIAGGNPLALIELPQMLTAQQRDGLETLEEPLPLSPTLQRAFGRRLAELPAETRMILLIAAASDSTELATIARAWEVVGLDGSGLEPAERARLARIESGRLEFRHPLVRAAVYTGANAVDRREAHRALAEAMTDARVEGRRAWHQALAAVGPDEAAATALEATANRARGRSSHAAARAYERAARLSSEDGARSRRLLAAAREWEAAGRAQAARELLTEAADITADPTDLAEVELLLGRITMRDGEAKRAAELLDGGAARITTADPERAALLLAEAADSWIAAGDLDSGLQSAKRAFELAWARGGATELAVTLRYGDVLGWRGEIEQATDLWLRAAAIPPGDDLWSRCLVGEALFSAGEDERARVVLEQLVEAARSSSALGLLAYALRLLALVENRRGRLVAAAAAAAEGHELARAIGQPGEHLSHLEMLTWAEALLGRVDDCRRHLAEVSQLRARLGRERPGSVTAGMLKLGLGRFQDAIHEFEAAVGEAEPRVIQDAASPRSFVPGLIEAYARAGRSEEARTALEVYETEARRTARPSAIAPALRCHALIDGEESQFRLALAEHERWDNPFERARTQAAYGEFLRRQKRRADARAQLRSALAAFEQVGATTWAERARTELRATGERARRREPSTRGELTPQELKVAGLVCEGLTNREIAERLFLSPKTIETHLVHVFQKLEVRSRTELALALSRSGLTVPA
jgi:DNA-binding CsgD family transcriptional regulator